MRTEAPPKRLVPGDAVAAIIVVEDGRYLLQHRDDIPTIWHPDHWGCFGGALDDGEDPIEALRRETFEELEFRISTEPVYFTRIDFDLSPVGLRSFFRLYYEVRMSLTELDRIVLHEGQEARAFEPDAALRDLRLTPYDSFALYLHRARPRLLEVAQQR